MDCDTPPVREDGEDVVPQTIAALAAEVYEGPLRTFQDDLDRIVSNGAAAQLDFDSLDTPVVLSLYTSPSPRDGLLSRMPSSA